MQDVTVYFVNTQLALYYKGRNVTLLTDHSLLQVFIMPHSCFDNTLNFDITLMPNGRDCIVISLDIRFYASVTFRLHFSMSN